MQWVRARLPMESDIHNDKCISLPHLLTYLSDVSCTSVNKLLSPAIDPEDPSLEHMVEGVDEVYQRLRRLHS